METSSQLRLRILERHLNREETQSVAHLLENKTSSQLPFELLEIHIGDSRDSWENAGFKVSQDEEGYFVALSGIKVRLQESSFKKTDLKFVFESNEENTVPQRTSLGNLEVEVRKRKERRDKEVETAHPNTCFQLAELVLYLKDAELYRKTLENVGIMYGDKPLKEMGDYMMAKYYFGAGSSKIRLLGISKTVESGTEETPKESGNWMIGTGSVDVEVTGWMPVAKDLTVLTRQLPTGEIKKAFQTGRSITTMKRGVINGLTGTFAFLSHGEGSPV